jgi:prepilin-type N-terminal cleavage/methylation domain-containing protein
MFHIENQRRERRAPIARMIHGRDASTILRQGLKQLEWGTRIFRENNGRDTDARAPLNVNQRGEDRFKQRGFSIIEFVIAMTVMLIVVGGIFSLVRDSMKVAMTTYEMTDAQQNMRTAQEFINRDLMNAGDGLESISNIRVPQAFVTSYVTLNPVTDPSTPGLINLGIFTTDNNVPANTAITGTVPVMNIRTGSDRQTILEQDREFLFNNRNSISLTAAAINPAASKITIPAGDPMTTFTTGEVYFLTSSAGGTFCTITSIDVPARQLSFVASDLFGLNQPGAVGNIWATSGGSTLATSLQRMNIIQYYVTSTGLLMRRVFGVQGSGFRESMIAEHVLDVQFNYSLATTDALGNVTPSATTALTSSAQQLAVRQVEVRVTVETPHALQNGSRQQLTTTTSTSVRNMQFRQAL